MKTAAWWLKTFKTRGCMLPAVLVGLLLDEYTELERKLAEAEAKLREVKG